MGKRLTLFQEFEKGKQQLAEHETPAKAMRIVNIFYTIMSGKVHSLYRYLIKNR